MLFVLVHAPVLGPTTWRYVGERLTDAGHAVAVPDLRPAVAAGSRAAFVTGAAAAVPTPDTDVVVVGHSGAGPLLPAVAAATGCEPLVVWADAGLPAADDPFLDRLRALAVDGVLPPWSEWFGPDLLATLVPDPALRSAVAAEQDRAPLAFFTAGPSAAPLPTRAAYLRLSEAYRPEVERAEAQGWPTATLASTHLGMVTDPDEVAAAIVALTGPRPGPGGRRGRGCRGARR